MTLSYAPGTIIGGTYRVLERLGRGGMGVVLRAHDEQLERDVAIKLIRPELLDDRLRALFLGEARAMARVCHPNVLPIYALGEHEGAPYFVTQVVQGQTVERWIDGRPKGMAPDLETAFKILEETCRGTAAVHAAATVHRDLKPSNLLLDASFSVRIADMGVAALLWKESALESPDIVGTPEYMAPEVVLQCKVSPELAPRADVYALGCLAYELFTGKPPFPLGGVLQTMMAHVTAPSPRPSARRAGLAPELDQLVLAAMAKEPEERTSSAEAFLRGLTAARSRTTEPVRILVADDDDDFREIFGTELHAEFPDAVVECVSDGDAAIAAFDRQRPSVAIVDLSMPKIGGTELTELLRVRPAARTVPIIVLTGSGGPAEWKRLSALGADGFLVKPVNIKDIGTLLRRVLAERGRNTPLPEAPAQADDDDVMTVYRGRKPTVAA